MFNVFSFLGNSHHGRPVLLGHSATDPSRHSIVPRRVFHVDHRKFLHPNVFSDEPTARPTTSVQERIHFWSVRRTDVLRGQLTVICKHLFQTYFFVELMACAVVYHNLMVLRAMTATLLFIRLNNVFAFFYLFHFFLLCPMPPQVPTMIIEPTVYTTIVYCMAGLQNDLYAYFLTVIITMLVMAVSTSCGPYSRSIHIIIILHSICNVIELINKHNLLRLNPMNVGIVRYNFNTWFFFALCFLHTGYMFNNIFGSLSLALTFVQPFDNVIMMLSGIFVNIRSVQCHFENHIVCIILYVLGILS